MRKYREQVDPQVEITAVWDEHEDETYRRDQSHWRGVGRWDDERWTNVGAATRRRVVDLFHTARRSFPPEPRPVMLEWGPGGGANVFAMADSTSLMYGVDISTKNLAEAGRVVAERSGAPFVPIHLTGEPESVVEHIDRPIDLFVSTAVFQHFPSKEYGRDVLAVVGRLLAPRGLGYVQIRFDNGNPKYAPKPVESYRTSHITATSYDLAEFWDVLSSVGLRPLKISNLNSTNNYAAFYFAAS